VSDSTTRPLDGLSDEARDMLEVIRGIDSEAAQVHPTIGRAELDERLGRLPGNEATRNALRELDSIGDLENVTRSGHSGEPVSFTLA